MNIISKIKEYIYGKPVKRFRFWKCRYHIANDDYVNIVDSELEFTKPLSHDEAQYVAREQIKYPIVDVIVFDKDFNKVSFTFNKR